MVDPLDISSIADEHARLLRAITELESAPAELRETNDLIKVVERDLADREKRLQELIKKRKSEAKDVDKLQRSGTKRFFFKLRHGGKEGLERKLEKEEREYVEAAQAEYNENQAVQDLKETLQVSKSKKNQLESDVADRQRMLRQINELYSSAFSGPTPEFPEEDAAEDELKAAEVHNEEVQGRLAHEKHVFSVLDKAATCANHALSSLQSANRTATYDTFGFGGIWAEMAEQDDLVRAQSFATQAERHMRRAREVQPLVDVVQGADVVRPEWLNVVFDNLYTDFVFQQKIRQSITSMTRFQQGIFAQCRLSEERVKELEQAAEEAKDFLVSRRRQLLNVRREILTRIREEGPSASGLREAPPAYNPARPGSPVLSMPGAFPDNAVRTTAVREPVRQPSGPPPPSYSSDAVHLRSAGAVQPSSVTSPATDEFQPRFAPPPGPPPQHARHVSTTEANSRPYAEGPPAPVLARTISGSSRTSSYTPPPGPLPSHPIVSGNVRVIEADGLARTTSTSSSYVTGSSRPATPGSPFAAHTLLHPHSPSRTPPRSRSPSPAPILRSQTSRPTSPLSPNAGFSHPTDSDNKSLPSLPSIPNPSIPVYDLTTNAVPSSSASADRASSSELGHVMLWGARDGGAGAAMLQSPSMPVPVRPVRPVSPHSPAAPSTSAAPEEPTQTGTESRTQFASNNPFRKFV